MKQNFFLSVIFAAVSLAAGEQPVADWNFDRLEEGQTVSSDGKFSAEVIRAEYVTPVPGKCGSALRISGRYRGNQAGALTIRNFGFDFTKPFTLEMIVRFDGGIKSSRRREIFSMADTEHGPGIRFSLTGERLEFFTGGSVSALTVRTDPDKLRISPEEWHLLTVTYDGKKIVLYYDGVPAGEKEGIIAPAQKTKSFSLGSYKNGLAYPLQGVLDEFRICDFCKTSAQTAEQYIAYFGE